MSESKFKQLQEEVCYKKPEEQEPDKICPTCIPNPNYIEPTWWQTEEPYLNEAMCEYQVKVVVNINGRIYHDPPAQPDILQFDESLIADIKEDDSKQTSNTLRLLSLAPYDFNTLLKTYIRPGVRKVLRHFDKLETDEIVCAAPPENAGGTCTGIFGLPYEKYISATEVPTADNIPKFIEELKIDFDGLKSEFKSIKNADALELVARVKDYYFVGLNKTLVVHIGIPAYRLDAVPDAPDLGSLNTSTDKIVIKPPDFMDGIQKFKSAMKSFKTFQSYFKQQENGELFFEETGDPFYIKFYSDERIDKFVDSLNKLVNANDFDLKGFNDTGTKSQNIAFEIEVSFDKSDEKNPFVVSNVRARKKNCPFVECKIGLPSFIRYSKTDQTMMGYFSDINNINSQLSTNVTPPWLDFIVSKTFPQLEVNYGSSQGFEENGCLSSNLQDLSDFILNETVDLFTTIEYQFNSNICKTKQEIKDQRKRSIGNLFSGDEESKQKLQELAKNFNEGLKDYDFVSDYKQFVKKVQNIEMVSPGQLLKDFFAFFSPCSLKKNLGVTLRCLAAGLTLDEMYYTIIKQLIEAGGEEALKIVLETLPANKQAEIEATIREQFKDMPAPWEPGWESGSLGAAVDRQAREKITQDELSLEDAETESASLSEKIEKTKEAIARSTALLSLTEEELKNTKEFVEVVAGLEIAKEEKQEAELDNQFQVESKKIDNTLLTEQKKSLLRLKNEIEQLTVDIQEAEDFNDDPILLENQKFLKIQQRDRLKDEITQNETKIKGYDAIIQINNDIIKRSNKLIKDFGTLSDYKKKIKKNQKKQEKKLEDLEKQQKNNNKKIKKLSKIYENLSDEEREELIEKQKEKTINVKLKPSDEIQEGTLGKALGNVQQALTQAYLDEIMKTATISELQRAYENIPGSGVLAKLVGSFKCASDPLVYPPIESFLSTLTFDPCGTESTRFSLPSINQIPTNFNWIELLGDAFYVGLKKIITNVLKALIVKAIQLIDIDVCKLTGNLLREVPDGGFGALVDELLCPDLNTNVPDDNLEDRNKRLSRIEDQRRRQQNHKTILSAGGASGRSQQSYNSLANLLSVSATQKEIKQAMVGKGDANFLSNISTLIKNAAPEFSDVFSDPQSTAQFFNTMGNFLTAEQRQLVIEDLNSPLSEFPVDASICLTKEERDLWDQERIAAFSNPAMGRAFVDKQNEKAISDLADTVDLYINGPNELLGNAINDAFNPKDPDCKNRILPNLSDYAENRREIISNAITGIFKGLEKAFIDDTIESNFFNPLNPPGILISLLSNRINLNLLHHNLINNNPIFRKFFEGGLELPKTVGIQMKQYIQNMETEVKVNEKVVLEYDNLKEDLEVFGINFVRRFTSAIEFNEYLASNKMLFRDKWNKLTFKVAENYEIPVEYMPEPSQDDSRFKIYILSQMIENIWSDFEVEFEDSFYEKFLEGANRDLYNKLPKKFLERQEGQSSEGFLYGNMDTPILEESDLVYVGPNGEEPYEDYFTEEDKVLGRSKTNNPRVHFLDPQKFGGTYSAPNIYVAEADHKGWLNFSKIIVPNPTGCDPKNSNFLMLDNLIKQIEKNQSSIQNHELISEDPSCTVELPFDKVANSNTLATLEGIVQATIRVYLSDFLIRTFPIFSNIHLDMNKNYNNLLANYISETIYSGLINEKSLFASTYEGRVYALLFLEQVVQIVHRKVRNGEIESNSEIEEVLAECNEIQENHPKIFEKDFKYFREKESRELLKEATGNDEYLEKLQFLINYVENGVALIGSGGPDILNSLQDMFFDFSGLTIERARFAAKIYSIYQVESSIKKLLKYVVKKELDMYSKKMIDELEPRPWIYDINKYFIGGSGILYGNQNNSGIFDFEVPIGGGQSPLGFGSIRDCPKQDMIHSLNNIELSNERYVELTENGGFYLEKYLLCKPKNDVGIANTNDISGIINISELKSFLQANSESYDTDKNISDYFGDAVLLEDGTGYNGTIGIKFGVRLCYIPPGGTNLGLPDTSESKKNRSFYLNPATFITETGNKTLGSSKYSFPIASFEQDIIDVKMLELLESNNNLNQDVSCYVDKLVETKNFKHLADNILNIKKVPSLYMIYSYINFLPSLGADSERDIDENDPTISISDIAKTFSDSKSAARSLFASYYKNNDRDPRNEEESNEDVVKSAQRRIRNSLSFLDLGSYSWDLRRRIRTNSPFDKDGNECKNDFGKLFTVKGG